MTKRRVKRAWEKRSRVPWNRIPREVQREIVRLAARGVRVLEIVRAVEVSESTVYAHLAPLGGVYRAGVWQPGARYLSLEDRCEIRLGLDHGESYRAIGRRVGRPASTVMREVDKNGGRDRYKPALAHEAAWDARRRAKPTKLASNPELCALVAEYLALWWSPEHIAGRLRLDHPNDSSMWVSHETIYKTLFVQARGELRSELTKCLRTGRANRKPRGGPPERRGRIADMVMISDRPPDASDRAVPGSWEGDLLIGANNKSAIGTLVERTSRLSQLVPLPDGYTAEKVRVAVAETIQALPDTMVRWLTWDQGREMSQHRQFTIDTGVQVYFCHPHSPWERPSNENLNGLLRQYLPRGLDLSTVPPERLLEIQDSLNNRPRKVLGFRTPNEVWAELVASTA